MWTAPDARRAGVGALLVRAVVDWATEIGSSSIGLWVTRGNGPAAALYESLGFRRDRRLPTPAIGPLQGRAANVAPPRRWMSLAR